MTRILTVGFSLAAIALLTTGWVLWMSPQNTASEAQPASTERPYQSVPTAGVAVPACIPIDAARPTSEHIVAADLNTSAYSVDVQQRIRYSNRTGTTLTQLVLNAEPNRWQNVFTLYAVTAANVEAETGLVGKRLTITLPEPLGPDCTVDLMLAYRLDIPRIGVDVYRYKGFFGHTDRQINLGHWLMTVAPYQGVDWVTRDPSLIGEQEVMEKADWQVTLNLTGEGDGYMIAAPGIAQQLTPSSWRFIHLDSREFAASISDQFRRSTRIVDDSVIVEVYTFNDPALEVAAEHALNATAQSVSMYSDLFGPYAYDRLLIVQGDFPDGMEFSGLAYVGSDWFTRWDGTAASYLTLITVHEVAHQWWYASVGNDPALAPWLDEALATYSEYIYLEEFHPDLKDWWWAFRVDYFAPEGFVDATVYEFESIRDYINAVYLRGVYMMHALREDLGTPAFFDLLAAYAEAGHGQIASPALFWSLFSAEQWALTEATRAQFLRQPNMLSPG